MPSKYNPSKIEKKWQKEWEKQKLYVAKFPSQKPKYYALVEFPYPSGDGLHVGHVRSYTAMDIVARKRRMEGYNVLYPIGWDAFGLPTENYAIKTQTHPKVVTKKNTNTFRRQLKSLGFSFDWSREINTTDPAYYKWTQWLFLKFFEAGLAYKTKTEINWCPKDKIGLANEEVVGGTCERCGTVVEKREKEQWMLKITTYAEKLLEGLKHVDYISEAKIQQENWIGKSEGAVIKFKVQSEKLKIGEEIEIFTTRPDTIFGATFLVLGPKHNLIRNIESRILNLEEVKTYIEKSRNKSTEEPIEVKNEKTGVQLKGIVAVNPATKQEIPVFIADYVLGNVGTGAIMAVPAHDERDFAFAKKYWLDIVPVVAHEKANGDSADHVAERLRRMVTEEVYTGPGTLLHSGEFNGMDSEKAKWKITEKLGGKKEIHYRLRDWIFSRQRYWGEPIPLVFCNKCFQLGRPVSKLETGRPSMGEILNPGWVSVPEKDLPVELPNVKSYTPTDTGESPLANIESWVRMKCPRCGGEARRETDVMPNWAGSSWYFLAYTMQGISNFPAKGEARKRRQFPISKYGKTFQYWLPVDWYNGGMEHTVLHLLYSRFWNQFLYDQKLVSVSEPYKKRTSHGLILGEGGIKMSKSKGNVVNPDDLTNRFGADSLRLYEMFMGPFDQHVNWDPHGIVGMRRFLDRTWNLISKFQKPISPASTRPESGEAGKQFPSSKNQFQNENRLERVLHQTIKKVSEDIENLRMNTALSSLMILLNEMESLKIGNWKLEIGSKKIFLLLLAPFAPHIVEELWYVLGEKKSIHLKPWPAHDPEKIKEKSFRLVIQVNGKVRATVDVPRGISKEEAEQLALSHERVINALNGKEQKKIIYVVGRLVNVVL